MDNKALIKAYSIKVLLRLGWFFKLVFKLAGSGYND